MGSVWDDFAVYLDGMNFNKSDSFMNCWMCAASLERQDSVTPACMF